MKSTFALILLLATFGFVGCDEVKTIDSQEFMLIAEGMKMTNVSSASWTSFLGVREGKAYLESGRLHIITGNPKIRVYCTTFKDLPSETRQMITYMKPPWVPTKPLWEIPEND